MAKLKNTTQKVRYILETMPETRENYNLLISAYWMLFDGIGEIKDIPKATSAETIMRIRRIILNNKEV